VQRGKALEVSKMKEKLLCYLAVGGMCDGFFFFEKHQIKPATLIDVRLSEDAQVTGIGYQKILKQDLSRYIQP
jgi:hypothetical protein